MGRILISALLAFVCTQSSQAAVKNAKNVTVIYDIDAVIRLANSKLPDQSDAITIDGKVYPLETLGESARNDLETIRGAHDFHSVESTAPGIAVGFFVEEKAFFPEPGVTKVFRALALQFPLPRQLR